MKRVWMVSPNVSYLEEKVVVLTLLFFFSERKRCFKINLKNIVWAWFRVAELQYVPALFLSLSL